ncbi:iron complex transport system ATP-binding protein [Arcanobacterium phocae]|uniref:Iron complex transport system ATP-binding protein n=1 Tax=Arcanobacterium phocae TaxID=131112 RepID=A0A1H2LJN9_9ACTO|nr:ATP-binding cassette domain-containing protein [Arcanobacterium phocae]SDU80801.1 iron complex transport system ATP-binding protein [Arcanobacterium phocae]
MGEVLNVSNVTVTRHGQIILDNVSWQVHDDERWVILGPNGAGKTTLIALATGRMLPTDGDVTLIGASPATADMSELKALIGVASQVVDAKISGRETVLDVVRTAAYGRSSSWTEVYEEEDTRRALGLLASLGVDQLADHPFNRISSGERKRVGIARALMSDPEVLVLDEPAAGLDFGGREQLMMTLERFSQAPYAPVIVLVTHHVEEIPIGFTHSLLMKEGKIFASGPIDDVLTNQNMTEVFGLDTHISKENGRYFAVAGR